MNVLDKVHILGPATGHHSSSFQQLINWRLQMNKVHEKTMR